MADDTFDTSKFYELLQGTPNDWAPPISSPFKLLPSPHAQNSESPNYPNGSRFFPSPLRSPGRSPGRSQSMISMYTPPKKTNVRAPLPPLTAPDWLDLDLEKLSFKDLNMDSPSPSPGSSPLAQMINSSPKNKEIPRLKMDLDECISPSNSNFPSPKIPYMEQLKEEENQEEFELEPSTRLLHYIHGIITRHDLELREYLVSVPNDTPFALTHKLIKKVFVAIGEIKSITELPFEDHFIKYRVLTWVYASNLLSTHHSNNSGPWKSIKFNLNNKDVKMLIFYESTLEKKPNEPFKIDPYVASQPIGNILDVHKQNFKGFTGSSKLEVCWYPEGYSSTLHNRGDDLFMYVRELPSKLNILRQRRGSALHDICEIKLSSPLQKETMSVNIDLRELDGKLGPKDASINGVNGSSQTNSNSGTVKTSKFARRSKFKGNINSRGNKK